MNEAIKSELTKRIGASQGCGEKGFARPLTVLSDREDYLSLYLRDAIENADEPNGVYWSIQYAVSQLNRAAKATLKYDEELEAEETLNEVEKEATK